MSDDTDITNSSTRKVVYEDGDKEDLSKKEILELAVDGKTPKSRRELCQTEKQKLSEKTPAKK